MIKNRIKEKLIDRGVSQAKLASEMPDDVGKVGMSFIVTGKVLPTKAGLDFLCKTLSCKPTDLYRPEDLNLLGKDMGDSTTEQPDTSQHEGQEQLRVWLRTRDKESIAKAVNELGYLSVSEWLREMVRNTVERNRMIQSGAIPETDHTESNHPS